MKKWFSSKAKYLVSGLMVAVLIVAASPISVSWNVPQALRPQTIGNGKLVLTIGQPNAALAAGEIDYLTDGVADNVQWAALMAVLSSHGGGEAYALTTNFTFAAATTVNVPANVTIRGTGRASYFAGDGVTPIFTATGNNTSFQDIRTDAGGISMGSMDGIWQNVMIGTTLYTKRPTGQTQLGGTDPLLLGDVTGETHLAAALNAANAGIALAVQTKNAANSQTARWELFGGTTNVTSRWSAVNHDFGAGTALFSGITSVPTYLNVGTTADNSILTRHNTYGNWQNPANEKVSNYTFTDLTTTSNNGNFMIGVESEGAVTTQNTANWTGSIHNGIKGIQSTWTMRDSGTPYTITSFANYDTYYETHANTTTTNWMGYSARIPNIVAGTITNAYSAYLEVPTGASILNSALYIPNILDVEANGINFSNGVALATKWDASSNYIFNAVANSSSWSTVAKVQNAVTPFFELTTPPKFATTGAPSANSTIVGWSKIIDSTGATGYFPIYK